MELQQPGETIIVTRAAKTILVTSMTSYKPIDSKREEFRKYLERTGVMDALTRSLVSLYEETEKPEDALAYVRAHLGGSAADDEKMKDLKKDNDELRAKLAKLQGRQSQAASVLEEQQPKLSEAAGEGPPEPVEEEEDEGAAAAAGGDA